MIEEQLAAMIARMDAEIAHLLSYDFGETDAHAASLTRYRQEIAAMIETAHDEPEEPPIYGCPVLGHDCSEARCHTKCRMSAFSWAEMAADRDR
jgi:hypothetical protein